MRRLGKNAGKYLGESIDIVAVLEETHRTALNAGWEFETFFEDAVSPLRAYRRLSRSRAPRTNLYLSTGIHGDEPSGPLAMLELLRENRWPDELNLWLVPCLNPAGFQQNTREGRDGLDLNRDYRHLRAPEIRAHVQWLARQPKFEYSVILHEDWEANGFYIYELNPENRPSLAEPILDAVREACPIETAEQVDSWECRGGIIRPNSNPEERAEWAEALYLIVHKSRQSYTLETPSDFPLETRVTAHVRAARKVLDLLG